MTDIFSSKKRSELMSRVKNKDTDIEVKLRKKLWSEGFRYRTHYDVQGKPDIAFPSKKVAIFCDGDFWHGRNFNREKRKYKEFWKTKIASNMARDKKVNRELKKEGWVVLRFWKTEILKDLDRSIDRIISALGKIN